MGFSVVFRRAVTAVSIYGSALLGILASVVAARELSKVDFSRFALVFAITGLLQLFLDVTVEEVVVKFGNRYIAREDWGRFHRLLRLALIVKTAGGAIGAVAVVGAAALAPWIWNVGGLRGALLVAALVPLLQAPEGMGSAILLLRNRYDVRGALLAWSMALRLAAIAVGASFGVVQAFVGVVVAQAVSTLTMSVIGLAVLRRYPAAPVSATALRSARSRCSRRSRRGSLRCAACCPRCSSASWPGRSTSGTSGSPRRPRPPSRRCRPRCAWCCSPSRRAMSSTAARTAPSRS
jgi:O-antigen/teichoic acid export membrane protein